MFSTEELSARAEIYDCLMRYCRGVDRGDAAIIASVYHPDSIDHHGPWSGSGSDFASYIVGEVDKTGILGQHHITNVLIELADGVAAVESYYWALHPLTDAMGAPQHIMFGGRYLDRFERRNGLWKVAERTVLIDFARPLEHTSPWGGFDSFPVSRRREQDPSYAFFGSCQNTHA